MITPFLLACVAICHAGQCMEVQRWQRGLIFIFVSALIGVSKTEPVEYRDVRHQIESEAMIL